MSAPSSHSPSALILLRYRIVLGFFIIALMLSGVTAFPLLTELELLARILGIPPDIQASSLAGFQFWIRTVLEGLRNTYAVYPWLAYGTDWLAFGHIVIALFFVGPWLDPKPNAWVLKIGLIACAGVFPLALLCGPIRGIPFYWRLIDCSFGLIGALPLIYCLRLIRKLESLRER